jgi:hypothetical protein
MALRQTIELESDQYMHQGAADRPGSIGLGNTVDKSSFDYGASRLSKGLNSRGGEFKKMLNPAKEVPKDTIIIY